MVDRVIERTETEAPRDTVVVRDDRVYRGSNVGTVIAVIVIILLLLFFFGGRLFGSGGSGGGPTTNTNIQAPSPTTTR